MPSKIEMKLPARRQKNAHVGMRNIMLITPGDVITEDTDYMKGHGESIQLNILITASVFIKY